MSRAGGFHIPAKNDEECQGLTSHKVGTKRNPQSSVSCNVSNVIVVVSQELLWKRKQLENAQIAKLLCELCGVCWSVA